MRNKVRGFIFPAALSIAIAFYSLEIFRMPAWFDEAFTMQQARIPLNNLLTDSFFGFDVVHFVYYLLSHFLLILFPDTLQTLRFLSLFATIFTGRIIYRIGTTLFGKNVGELSTIIFFMLPSTFDYATQARSTALVSFFVAMTILILMNFNRLDEKHLVYKTNIFVAGHLLMNFLSISLIPLYLALIYIKDKNTNLIKAFQKKFFMPIVSVIPMAVIAKMQERQVAWISENYSPQNAASRILLWPFIESENRYTAPLLRIMLTFAVISFAIFLKSKSTDQNMKSLIFWFHLLFLFPPIVLWIFSLGKPLFMTRYFAYSGIGFALITAIRLTTTNRRVLKSLAIVLIAIGSWQNISGIVVTRAADYNWKEKNQILSQGPTEFSVVSSPEWYSIMLKYYSPRGFNVTSIVDIREMRAISTKSECLNRNKNIWLIGKGHKIDPKDRRDLLQMGYQSDSNISFSSNGVELFTLKICENIH